MARPPAFQFYPADFIADENVVLMSLPEVGAYIKLLCFCWREGSIPTDVELLSRLVGCDSSAMASYMTQLSKCFTEREGRYVHSRLDRELEKQIAFHENRKEAGEAGAKARWGKKLSANGKAIAKHNSSAIAKPMAEPMAKNGSSSSSSSSDITPIVPKAHNDYCSTFELWWERYPKHIRVAKGKAFEAWKRAGKKLVARGMSKDQAAGFLQQKVIEFANSPRGHRRDVSLNPASWLNGGRYDDPIEALQQGDQAESKNRDQQANFPEL